MTTGEFLRSKSSAPANSSALIVLENITGTGSSTTVFMPKDYFICDIMDTTLSADIKNKISADIEINLITADFIEEQYSANIIKENLNGNIN